MQGNFYFSWNLGVEEVIIVPKKKVWDVEKYNKIVVIIVWDVENVASLSIILLEEFLITS